MTFIMLSATEETDLFNRFQNGDKSAADRLILSHVPLVRKMAAKLSGYSLSQEDLIQEGIIGLTKAVQRFDINAGVRLSTYAAHWINAEMLLYVTRNQSIVNIVTTKEDRKAFFNLRKYRSVNGKMSSADVAQAAKDLNLSEKDILDMQTKLLNNVSLDISNDDDADTWELSIESPNADPAELYENFDTVHNRSANMSKALQALNEREADVIAKRWLSDIGKATMQELADKHGVSAARIQQIEAAAIKKMKIAVEFC